MSAFVILLFFVFGNWVLSDALIFIPINWGARITSFSGLILTISTLLFLGWCIGDDELT